MNNANGRLTVTDGNSNSITLDPAAQTVNFYNATSNSTNGIAPYGGPIVFVATDNGQALGNSASVTGNAAFALGNDVTAAGDGSFTLGNNLTASYLNSIVLGQWNAPISGSSSGNVSASPTDPLFVVGNGADSGNLSNAMVILKNGNTTLNGSTTINGSATFNGNLTAEGGANLAGIVTVQPQGDIPMGQFQ